MQLKTMRNHMETGMSIFDMPLRVTFYARVSTEKDEQLNSLDNQVRFFENYIVTNPNWTYVDGYVDEGISGFHATKREAFMRMIQDAQSGKFDFIVTKEISRFARNIIDSIKYTRELLLENGVGVYFKEDGINTFDKDAELRLIIMSGLAQDEIRKLSERVRFGHNQARKKGVIYGQSNIYGYDRVDGQLVINEKEAELVRRIFTSYAEGKLGLRRIARDLETAGYLSSTGKMFTYATLSKIIQNPKYKGYYAANIYSTIDYRDARRLRNRKEDWIVHKDLRIPAIVSEELWEACNRLLRERGTAAKTHAPAYQNRYTYSGKIFCGEHGTAYHRHVYRSKKRGEQECWNCKLYRLKGRENGCDSPTIYSTELDEILGEIYQTIYLNKDEIIKELLSTYAEVERDRSLEKEQKALSAEIADRHRKKNKLLELIIGGFIKELEFKQRNDALNDELTALEANLSEIERCLASVGDDKKRLMELKRALNEEWLRAGTEKISEKLLDRIIVYKEGGRDALRLEIFLKLGAAYHVDLTKGKDKNYSITLAEVGISQAQVSRLEKNAINQIKKNI